PSKFTITYLSKRTSTGFDHHGFPSIFAALLYWQLTCECPSDSAVARYLAARQLVSHTHHTPKSRKECLVSPLWRIPWSDGYNAYRSLNISPSSAHCLIL